MIWVICSTATRPGIRHSRRRGKESRAFGVGATRTQKRQCRQGTTTGRLEDGRSKCNSMVTATAISTEDRCKGAHNDDGLMD